MKRAIALLITLLMVLSVFPMSALADDESTDTPAPVAVEETATPEPTAVPEETPVPEDTATPEPSITPEATATEALASESPSLEALFLNFLDCDSLDADGTGHTDVLCLAGDALGLKVKAETNGELSYRWQVLDQTSTADDPYVDISTSDEPTADKKELSILADAAVLGVADYYRCVVTAKLGEETVASKCYFTLKSSDPTAAGLTGDALDLTAAFASNYVNSAATLKAAILAKFTNIYTNGSFSISENIEIPAGVEFNVMVGNTVTLDSGATFTNNGTIYVYSSGILDISNGTLSNAGMVQCALGGTLDVEAGGAYSATGSNAQLILFHDGLTGISTISGVDHNQITYIFNAYNEDDLSYGLSDAVDGYASATVFLEMATTLAADQTIPKNVTFALDANLTVNSGATLTVSGDLIVPDGFTLTNHGTIVNNGSMIVNGSLVSDGSIEGDGYYYNPATASTEAAVRDAITSGKTYITVSGGFTLSADLTIPGRVTLDLTNVQLTVPSGKTLTVEGSVDIYGTGRLLVKSGATLANNGTVNAVSGTLLVETGATYTGGFESLNLYSKYGTNTTSGTITGIKKSQIVVVGMVSSDGEIRNAIAFGGQNYAKIEIDLMQSITLASDLVLPEEAYTIIGAGSGAITLSVPYGKKLTNNGEIFVNPGDTLKINTGATLVNNGRIEAYGTYVNDGTYTGTGILTTGDKTVTSWDEFIAAINAHRANIYVNSDVELANDVTIPVGTTVLVGADGTHATLSIPAGKTLTVNGSIAQTDGMIEILADGKLINNGTVQVEGGSFGIDASGSLVNNSEFDLSETGTVTNSGSYEAGENGSFNYMDDKGASFSGIPASMVYYMAMADDVSAFETALGKAAVGYQMVQITLNTDITLSTNYDIPKNVSIIVANSATLTIDTSATVSLYGNMFVDKKSMLQINSGAELIIKKGGALQVNGTLVNNGTITNKGDFGTSIDSYAALTAAIANGVTSLDITSSFSLAGDVILQDNMMLTVVDSTLTIPAGRTMTVYGNLNLSNGAVTVASSGKLLNYGNINLPDQSVLSINTGATYTQAADAYLAFTYGVGTISGVSKDKISCTVEATTETALRSGLALSGYRELYVNLYSTVVLSADLSVPANVDLNIQGNPETGAKTTLAVPSGRKLTCAGSISLMDDSILDIRTGGTLQMTSTGMLSFTGGTMKADGTVNYASGSVVNRSVYTESQLLEAIASKTTEIFIAGEIELSDDLVLPNGIAFTIVDGGSLTIPSGKELSIGVNECWIVGGTLTVSTGATMNIPNGGSITLDGKGLLAMDGTVNFGGNYAKLFFHNSGSASMSGETAESYAHTYAMAWVSDMSGLEEMLSMCAGSVYASYEIHLTDSITLDKDLTVPSPLTLMVTNGDTLTVPSGYTLKVDSGAALRVQDGGKLVVNGTLDNYGESKLSLNDVSGSGAFNDYNGSLAFSTKVTSLAQLKTVLGSGRSPLDIECSGFAITSNLTIPADVRIRFNVTSIASIASGITVTNNGILSLYGKFTISGTLINNNYLQVVESATLTNNGTFKNTGDADVYGAMVNNGTVTVTTGRRVRFHGDAKLSGTKATGTWYSIDGKDVTGLEIVGPKYVGIGVELTQNYIVEMIPTDAWPVDVHWSIVDGATFAEIAEETGELTGKAEGDVVIRATSLDDDTIYADMTVHIVDYSVAISGGDSMVAGKTLQLTGSFVPASTTASKILWSLADGDSAYASISPSGLVTAKAVTETHTITVTARDAAGVADEATQEIKIYPDITDIRIMMDVEKDGVTDVEDVTGKTLVLNSNDAAAELALTGMVIPIDGMMKITWTLSSTDAATMAVTGDRSVTITPVAGKTQLLTLTAKSNDGSGKSASIKIQVAALSVGVVIGDDLGGLLNAGGKTQLYVTFTNPKPSNGKVTWYLAPEYEAYATLSATGLLTAKAVTEAVTVQVVAIPLDGGTKSEPYAVTIKPVPTAVSILEDGDYVTNATLMLNLRGTPEVQLTAKPWPDDASDSVIWKSSAPTIATVDATGKVTGLKAGTAMISATTAIGTKTASVKIVVSSLAQAIDIYETETSKALDELRGGMSATYRVYDATEGGTKQVLPASAVNWTLDSVYAPYATLTSAGALTTYPVSKATRIVLHAEVIGNKSAFVEYGVWIYPATQSVTLYQGTALQTKPIVIDSYLKTSADIEADSVTLKAQILPSGSMEGVTWTSSNMNVAQVVDGVVKPVSNGSGYNKGTAIITAKVTDGTNIAASVQVVVTELVQGITLAPSNTKLTPPYELKSGSTMQLKATIDNPTATNKSVVYSILDGADYATISASGLLTAKLVYGDRIVTVQATPVDGGKPATLDITVKTRYAEPLTIVNLDEGTTVSGETVSVDVSGISAKSTLFNLSVPEAVSTTKVKWSVAPSYVASVVTSGSDTSLKYLATGTAVVTATATEVGGLVRTASFTIELYKPATSLTITPPKGVAVDGLTLASGKTMLLTGVIAPATGVTTKGVDWSIDAAYADYATISSSGLLTAKAGLLEPETIFVDAVTKNAPYCKDTIKVLLTPLSTSVDILKGDKVVNGQTLTLDLSDPTLDLDTVVYEDGKANPNVVWTSSNKTLATVDADGVVKGLKAGTVTVTAKTVDGSGKFATVKVVILTSVAGMEITSKTGFDMCGGKTLQLGITFTPTTPTDKRVVWSLSTADAQYATISAGGLLKANALTSKKSITVIATSVENKDLEPETQVINIYPATTTVQILNSEAEVLNGKTLTFDLYTMTSKTLGSLNQPSLTGGALQGVIWKSSNTAVLTISADGEIAPVINAKTGLYNTGTVTITATAKDGSGKTATVKIVAGYLVSAISFDGVPTVQGGKTLTLKPLFDPTNVTNKKLTWTMKASDTPYATISSTGVLTAKKVTESKNVTVYCTAQDGSGVIGEATISITP